jgi:fructose-bisphosphate aldolase class II
MKKCVECGVSKVNVNKVVAHKYYDYTGQAWSNTELTKLIENGITEFQEGIEIMMDWLGATGKGGL